MTTITSQPDKLALAGLGLDKPMLLRVARILLADIYWDDEQESLYHDTCAMNDRPVIRDLMDRPETPQVSDEVDALIRMAGICGRIEQAWGESFYSVARRIHETERANTKTQEELQEDLVYYALMAAIGHGVGPCDVEGFPPELEASPINIENPMLFQLSLLP
jgi:hypothetical protein